MGGGRYCMGGNGTDFYILDNCENSKKDILQALYR